MRLWYELTYLERIVSTAVRTSLLLRRYLLQTLLSTAILILVFHSTSKQTPWYYFKTVHTLYILIHYCPATSHSVLNLSSLFSVLKLLHNKPNSTWILTTSESITHMNVSFNYILQNTFYSGYRILTILVQLSTKGRRSETSCRFFWLTSTFALTTLHVVEVGKNKFMKMCPLFFFSASTSLIFCPCLIMLFQVHKLHDIKWEDYQYWWMTLKKEVSGWDTVLRHHSCIYLKRYREGNFVSVCN